MNFSITELNREIRETEELQEEVFKNGSMSVRSYAKIVRDLKELKNLRTERENANQPY